MSVSEITKTLSESIKYHIEMIKQNTKGRYIIIDIYQDSNDIRVNCSVSNDMDTTTIKEYRNKRFLVIDREEIKYIIN